MSSKSWDPQLICGKTPKSVLGETGSILRKQSYQVHRLQPSRHQQQHQWHPDSWSPSFIQPAKTIEKPRVASMPPSEPQPALPTPVPPSPPRIPSVSVPKPHPVIQENDRPHKPTGSGNNNKAIPMVSVSKPPGPVQVPDKPQDTTKETTTLHRSNRVSKPNKRHADTLNIASVVKNNLWLWSKKPPKGTVQMF